ncbi:glycosyltransferase [Amphibacillus jilinensis]|uniref:glycosyltransferase n=1 Tax=Amphibacillus jilinensis TaxID=1216008 RepID=UPI001375984E|nr:glycosyltransferase [Amphibacillus jilinensis]
MKKILFLSHMYPTNNDKSYGKVVHQQAISLLGEGNEIKVVSPIPYVPAILRGSSKRFNDYYSTKNIEVHDRIEVHYPRFLSIKRSPVLFNLSSFFMFASVLKRVKIIKKTFDFEVIHAHFGFPDAFVAMKIAELFNIKLITTYQSTDLDKTYQSNRKLRGKLTKAFKVSDELISPSPRLTTQLKKVMNLDSHTIGYGIDLEEVSINNDYKSTSKPTMISVSRLVESKGINHNIEAISILHEKGVNIDYIVVGDGPEKKNLIKLVNKLGIKKYVKFTGALSHEEAIKQISSADIFSLPSWQETFGLVYLEAMANFKPVIGCKGQGFDGIIENGKNGFLAQPKSTESVCNIIQHILENQSEMDQLVKRARVTAEDYTFEVIANKINILYRN